MSLHPFPVWPEELEQYLALWRQVGAPSFCLDEVRAWTGERVVAITVGGGNRHPSRPGLYVAQPHAHEPGCTAGIIDALHQILTGEDLDAQPTRLDRGRVLEDLLITFNPIGNPWGRRRMGQRCWDGSHCDHQRFLLRAFGEDPSQPGTLWPRYAEWSWPTDRPGPDPVGFVYEPVADETFVEPNRSARSSYFRLFHRLDARSRYTHWMDLHQTEFPGQPINCEVWQTNTDPLPPEIERGNRRWAGAVIDAWEEMGFRPGRSIRQVARGGMMESYFRQLWMPLHRRMHILNAEVKNNSPDVSAAAQRRAVSAAVIASIQHLLDQ